MTSNGAAAFLVVLFERRHVELHNKQKKMVLGSFTASRLRSYSSSSPKWQNANVEVLLPCQGELKKELIILEDVEVHC